MLEITTDGDRIALRGELQVMHLERLGDALTRFLGGQRPITVDVSDITEVDTAGLQYILSFLKTSSLSSGTRLLGMSPQFEKALEITGLHERFSSYLN